MALFAYKAVTAAGQVVEGEMEATSRNLVVERLRAQGHVPIRAEPHGQEIAGYFHRQFDVELPSCELADETAPSVQLVAFFVHGDLNQGAFTDQGGQLRGTRPAKIKRQGILRIDAFHHQRRR